MNTGVQDALNLSWRLAMACSGAQQGGWLGGYDPERRRSAELITAKALDNYGKTLDAARAAGADPGLAHLLVSSTSSVGAALRLPLGLQRRVVQGGLSLGLRVLYSGGAGSAGERLRRLHERGGMLELIYPSEDIDCSYGSAGGGVGGVFRSSSQLVTVLREGARVPHVWLQVLGGEGGASASMVSTVQLPALLSRGGSPRIVLMLSEPAAAAAALNTIREDARYLAAFALVSTRRSPAEGSSRPVETIHRSLQSALQVPYFNASEERSATAAATGVVAMEGLPAWAAGEELVCEDVSGGWEGVFSSRGGAAAWAVALRPDGRVLAVLPAAVGSRAVLDSLLVRAMEQ